MYNYPTKRKPYSPKKISSSNRGMKFEEMINESNKQYLERDFAVIHKKPTPIQIVNMEYKSNDARIKDAFFKSASTTDYNGVYHGFYIDFDAKQCNSLTSFPLSDIKEHQITHLNQIKKHGGIGFLLIYFNRLNEIYLLYVDKINEYNERAKNGGKKSISISEFRENAILIKESFPIRVPYLNAVDVLIENKKLFK